MDRDQANPKILDKLRDRFDTRKLEAAVFAIDNLTAMRDELYLVYAKARGLIDGIHNPAADTDERPVWEVADEIMAEFGASMEKLHDTELRLEQLIWLNPKLEAEDLP